MTEGRLRPGLRYGLRAAGWLTQNRVLGYSRLLLAMSLCLFALSIDWTGSALPIAHDFAAFWTAARLAAGGHPAAAYSEDARRAMAALFGPGTYPPFFYSPIALLLWLPFAFLPAAAGAALWVAGTAAAYALTLRALLRTPAIVPLLAFPAVFVCALYGQNALFSTALFAGVALALDRAPVLAGILIGCLAYKPQLGILVPLALLCARRFAVFASAAGTLAILAAASCLAFGPGIWTAFAESLPVAGAWNARGVPGFDRFASPFAAARLLGAPETAAWLLQVVAAAIAVAGLVLVSSRRPAAGAQTAMLVVATSFCVPFLGEYDLVVLAVAGAWMVADARRTAWLPYEAAALAALYVSPALIKAAALHGVPLAPVFMTLLMALVFRRAQREAPQSCVLLEPQ